LKVLNYENKTKIDWIVVDVATHISKLEGVAEIAHTRGYQENKTDKNRIMYMIKL